ncbi:MAG: carboxypeptidase-like regulatory domain-containing protein [Reichenbachiella sp.]
MRRLLSVIFFFVLLGKAALGQTLSGTLYDSETKEVLPFATISIANQYRGTVSNIEGRFVLDIKGTTLTDSIVFSYVGFETLRIAVSDISENETVYLKSATISLQEVQVLSKQLSAKDIVKLVYENYSLNHPSSSSKQEIFYHRFERTPFPEENRIKLKKTNFPGLEEETFNELFEMIPDEFVEYRDAQVELYCMEGKSKLLPIDGISMEEASQKDLQKEMEDKLGEFLNDIEKTKDEEDVYYKFRSGIFAGKADLGEDNDSTENIEDKDSLNYHLSTDYVKGGIQSLLKNYAGVESKNLSFINSTGKYEYAIDEITVFNDLLVYRISFIPKGKGPFEGTMFVTTDTYAIIKLDFEYAEGKETEKFQLMGIGHAMNFKKGSVLFEKRDSSYFVKYIYAEERESASIERKLSLMKKQKRFLFDKELNEFKIDMELYFDINNYWEMLVLDRTFIDESKFKSIDQPKKMLFKKKYAYSSEDWNNSTVIAPTKELEKYKRK